MTTATTIIDYFIQNVEAGFSKEDARKRAEKMLRNFREETKKDEFIAICGIIERLSKI